MANSVTVGDTMRISVPLLREIHDRPLHRSALVRVVDVRIDADGHKELVVTTVDERLEGDE
jgi:hypothetical protein